MEHFSTILHVNDTKSENSSHKCDSLIQPILRISREFLLLVPQLPANLTAIYFSQVQTPFIFNKWPRLYRAADFYLLATQLGQKETLSAAGSCISHTTVENVQWVDLLNFWTELGEIITWLSRLQMGGANVFASASDITTSWWLVWVISMWLRFKKNVAVEYLREHWENKNCLALLQLYLSSPA